MAENRFFHLSLSSPALGRLEEAERFFLEGNLNEALAAAQQAWREYPKEPDVFRVLAYIHMARGEYPPAAQAGYQSVLIDGDNPASYAVLVQVYITFGMYKDAEETLTLARQRFPDDPALLVLAADLRFRQHRNHEGAQFAQQALSVNAGDNYARALLGVYYLKAKRCSEAREMLMAAVKAYPKRWDYQRDLGISLLNLGTYDAARLALTESFRLNPADLSTKQHLMYSLKFSESRFPTHWKISYFFYKYIGVGWLLNILGIISLIIGLIWFIVISESPGDFSSVPLFFTLGGLALILLTFSGITMRSRRGKKIDAALRKAVEKYGAGGQTGA